jgi:hypothetical protein
MSIDPEDLGLLKLRKLLTLACSNKTFMDKLLTDPAKAAQTVNITLTDDDVTNFGLVQEDLRRFGGDETLTSGDAQAWAVGMLLTRAVCPIVVTDRWTINPLSIRRFSFVCAPDPVGSAAQRSEQYTPKKSVP